MRIGINLFLGLMFAVVGGVLFRSIIEFPVELYYDTEVDYTATNYSYEPGTSGTSYQFYIKREGRGFEPLAFFPSFGIPTLFYFACFSLLGLVRWLMRRNKPLKEIPKNKFDEKTYKKLLLFREKSRKRNPTFTVVLLFLIALFFYSGRNSLFGLGLGNSSTELNQEASNFEPSHLVYSPDKKGSGDLWLIQEDKDGEGATYIDENQSSTSFDSIIYTIKTLNPVSQERQDVDQFIVSDEFSSFDAFETKDKIWLTARPNLMKVYDSKSRQLLYDGAEPFADEYKQLSSGIYKFYRHDYNGGDVLRIETLDGGLFYYHFESDSLVEKLNSIDSDGTFMRFGLKKVNGERFNLSVADLSQELVFTDNVELIEALNDANIHIEQSFVKYEQIEQTFFIGAELLSQSNNLAFILHQKDIRENSLKMISAVDTAAQILWSVESSEFPTKKVSDHMPGKKWASASIDGNSLIVNFIQDWEVAGAFAISISSGEIQWSLSYRDLAK